MAATAAVRVDKHAVIQLPFILALLFLLLNSQPQAQGLFIGDFDAPNRFEHSIFSNSAEFPGASGTRSVGPAHEGRSAILTCRFTCLDQTHRGKYVAAIWKSPSPIDTNPGEALPLSVRLSPDVRLIVRTTGQTLQFLVNTPMLEHLTPGERQTGVVPITGQATEHWGANNAQLRGRVLEIATLVQSRYGQRAKGQIAFDDVERSRPAHTGFHPDLAAAFITAPKGTERLRPRLGVNIHFLKDDRALDLARDAGFSFVRMDLLWAKLEKQRRYDFSPFDGLMSSLEARGMSVLWLMDYGHPEHGGETPRSEEDIAAYARYAAAAVAHFRGHHAMFEIWNEPNGKQFFANPAVYPRLLGAALDAIRREDPYAAVSTGGTSGIDFPFLTGMLESGSSQKASAIAVHPYRNSAPETLGSDLSVLRDLIQRTAGSNKPVWNTEWGYSSYGNFSKGLPEGGHSDAAKKRQAVLVARECLTTWVLGLPITVLYDLRDDGSNPFSREDNFGLIDQKNSDKPAMKAVRALTSVAQNHTYAGLIRDVPYGLHAMRLDGPDDVVFVIWNENTQMLPGIRFSRNELLSVTNLFGERMNTQSEEILLEEAQGPIYLRLKRN